MKEKKDNETISEKIENGLDEFMIDFQDAIYGEKKDFTSDIPATIEKPNGIRKVDKVQTRRNINKRLFANKTFVKVILTVLLIGFFISLIIYIFSFILKY